MRTLNLKKVYFYTGSFTHTFYKEIFRYPPTGYTFIPSSPDLTNLTQIKKDIAQSARWYFAHVQRLQQLILLALAFLRIPKFRSIVTPDCDLIHSAQYPLLNKQPWVIDFEDVSAFTWYRPDVLRSPRAKRTLERIFASPSCRAILPWTEAAKKSLENGLDCRTFKEKIKIVSPVVTPQADIEAIFKEKKSSQKINILFIGTTFFTKGGVESLRVVDKLSDKYPIEFSMVSNVPEEIKEKYSANDNIKFYSRIPGPELTKLYRRSHLFLAPYHTDTFGFVILEAFSYGIPCVATDLFAIPEIVTHGKTGIIFRNSVSRFNDKYLPVMLPIKDEHDQMIEKLKNPSPQYLKRFEDALVSLISDRNLIEKLGRSAYAETKSGKFSPVARRQKMESVYTDALKSAEKVGT